MLCRGASTKFWSQRLQSIGAVKNDAVFAKAVCHIFKLPTSALVLIGQWKTRLITVFVLMYWKNYVAQKLH